MTAPRPAPGRAMPERSALAAIEFLLLDVERIAEPALHESVRDAVVMRHAAAQIGMDYGDALRWAADSLVAQGLLRREGDELLDA